MSSFEIKYFFYNSLCKFGKKWHSSGIVDRYQLFKNLPQELGNGILPKKYCPNIIFDWEEDEESTNSIIEDTKKKIYIE